MLSLLGIIEQCLKAGKKQHWRAASITNICVGLLAGFKVLFILLLVLSKYLVWISPDIMILLSFLGFTFLSTTNIKTRDFGFRTIYFSGRKYFLIPFFFKFQFNYLFTLNVIILCRWLFLCYHLMFFEFEWKSILAEGDICPSQRRASSEGLGYLARFGNDIFTARMASFSFCSIYIL